MGSLTRAADKSRLAVRSSYLARPRRGSPKGRRRTAERRTKARGEACLQLANDGRPDPAASVWKCGSGMGPVGGGGGGRERFDLTRVDALETCQALWADDSVTSARSFPVRRVMSLC